MTDLMISGEVAERLAELARHEHRSIEAFLTGLLDDYQHDTPERVEMSLTSVSPSLKDFPVDDLGPWPEGLTLRRDELYGDDER